MEDITNFGSNSQIKLASVMYVENKFFNIVPTISSISRTVLEKFYAHGSPDEIFREDLLSAKTGLEVVFEKLLLHALDTSHLIDESNHQEILDTVGDTKNEVEFMICEINDAIMYLEEASAKSKKSSE